MKALLYEGVQTAGIVDRAMPKAGPGEAVVKIALCGICGTDLHIYFPDPWPKKRHWKRRLINSGFVESVRCVLVPGGQLCVATDFQDYFDEMLQAADA